MLNNFLQKCQQQIDERKQSLGKNENRYHHLQTASQRKQNHKLVSEKLSTKYPKQNSKTHNSITPTNKAPEKMQNPV